MAIRLRKMSGGWIALCAVQYKAAPGDIYLDDAQDHAIRNKLKADWLSESYMFDPKEEAL